MRFLFVCSCIQLLKLCEACVYSHCQVITSEHACTQTWVMWQPAMVMWNMCNSQSWQHRYNEGFGACADLSNDVDAIFISKNDRLYRPPYAREPNTTAYNNYIPYFICSVSMHSSSALETQQACKAMCQGHKSAKHKICWPSSRNQQAESKV